MLNGQSRTQRAAFLAVSFSGAILLATVGGHAANSRAIHHPSGEPGRIE